MLVLSDNQKLFLNSQMGLYFALYLAFSMGMLGTVLATNLVEFYAFFELMLGSYFFLDCLFWLWEPKKSYIRILFLVSSRSTYFTFRFIGYRFLFRAGLIMTL